MSQEDRKQSRSSKNAVRRKARRQAEAAQKLVSKLNPGLGNKYEKAKMMRGIQGAKNVTTASGGEESSGREFQHLCEVLQSASGIRDSECHVGREGHGGRCQGHQQESSSTEVMSQRQGGLPRRVMLF